MTINNVDNKRDSQVLQEQELPTILERAIELRDLQEYKDSLEVATPQPTRRPSRSIFATIGNFFSALFRALLSCFSSSNSQEKKPVELSPLPKVENSEPTHTEPELSAEEIAKLGIFAPSPTMILSKTSAQKYIASLSVNDEKMTSRAQRALNKLDFLQVLAVIFHNGNDNDSPKYESLNTIISGKEENYQTLMKFLTAKFEETRMEEIVPHIPAFAHYLGLNEEEHALMLKLLNEDRLPDLITWFNDHYTGINHDQPLFSKIPYTARVLSALETGLVKPLKDLAKMNLRTLATNRKNIERDIAELKKINPLHVLAKLYTDLLPEYRKLPAIVRPVLNNYLAKALGSIAAVPPASPDFEEGESYRRNFSKHVKDFLDAIGFPEDKALRLEINQLLRTNQYSKAIEMINKQKLK